MAPHGSGAACPVGRRVRSASRGLPLFANRRRVWRGAAPRGSTRTVYPSRTMAPGPYASASGSTILRRRSRVSFFSRPGTVPASSLGFAVRTADRGAHSPEPPAPTGNLPTEWSADGTRIGHAMTASHVRTAPASRGRARDMRPDVFRSSDSFRVVRPCRAGPVSGCPRKLTGHGRVRHGCRPASELQDRGRAGAD